MKTERPTNPQPVTINGPMQTLQTAADARRAAENAQYEAREISQYYRDAARTDAQQWTNAERAEQRAEYADFLRDATWINERVSWLFAGTFGKGAQLVAQEIRSASKRRNKAAAIGNMMAHLEQHLTPTHAAKAWKTLTPDEQATANAAIIAAMIESAETEADEAENDAQEAFNTTQRTDDPRATTEHAQRAEHAANARQLANRLKAENPNN